MNLFRIPQQIYPIAGKGPRILLKSQKILPAGAAVPQGTLQWIELTGQPEHLSSTQTAAFAGIGGAAGTGVRQNGFPVIITQSSPVTQM